jgi:hypothetical protein
MERRDELTGQENILCSARAHSGRSKEARFMFALGGNDISEDQRDKCSSHIVELDDRVPEVLIHAALSP